MSRPGQPEASPKDDPRARLALQEALADAVEQQRATSEILQVISRTPSDLSPVFQKVVDHALALCGADNADLLLREGDEFVGVASAGQLTEDQVAHRRRQPERQPEDRRSIAGRVALERGPVKIDDSRTDPHSLGQFAAQTGSMGLPEGLARSLLGVALFRDEQVIGVLLVRRQEMRPFGDREIPILEAFAAQAAIAIENVRLVNETREAHERQTATSNVLSAISDSASDPQPMFDRVVTEAARICRADFGILYRAQYENDVPVASRAVAAYNIPEELARENQRVADETSQKIAVGTFPPERARQLLAARVFLEGRTVHVPDVLDDPQITASPIYLKLGVRAVLGVPLRGRDLYVGSLSLWKRTAGPFEPSAVRLVENFADQVVIALENARSRETVERQRAELRRFLAPQVADLITSAEGQALLAGHRSEITVVFCDLRGFTAFSETAEPEEALAVVRTFHATLGPLVFEHGGTLEHFEGDGAMVFFNDPVPVEDHVLRAVRMTLAMRERMAEHVAAWRKRGHELGFGCGIATGYATLGRIGFEGRYDYGAIGPVTNLASRLASEAKAGQILLSQRAFAQIEQRIDVEPIGEVSVKGYSRPQAAYNVGRLKEPVHA